MVLLSCFLVMTAACSSKLWSDVPSECGNGETEGNEACDDGNTVDTDDLRAPVV